MLLFRADLGHLEKPTRLSHRTLPFIRRSCAQAHFASHSRQSAATRALRPERAGTRPRPSIVARVPSYAMLLFRADLGHLEKPTRLSHRTLPFIRRSCAQAHFASHSRQSAATRALRPERAGTRPRPSIVARVPSYAMLLFRADLGHLEKPQHSAGAHLAAQSSLTCQSTLRSAVYAWVFLLPSSAAFRSAAWSSGSTAKR